MDRFMKGFNSIFKVFDRVDMEIIGLFSGILLISGVVIAIYIIIDITLNKDT
tara:strand:- start:540 stop:695 length:156 start_codon:yes stop_codon:yes gene_type:complete